MSAPEDGTPADAESKDQRTLELIQAALRGLRFGQITITVQDGVVIQIERSEKTRLRGQ